METYFKEHYKKITYPIALKDNIGLRNAQLGAIHAVSSFYTINNKDAAIIVMPTGAGKTAVLELVPFLILKTRVLVVTPSKMVRGQIAEDYSQLSTLCNATVFNSSMKKPKVYEMEHFYKPEYDDRLTDADVIVTTPNCGLSLSESEWAKTHIDIVEVDEAHHTPAKTWKQILINLADAAHILFTATPFRLDKKELKGEIIFDYPLSKAYEDGIFGEIQYVPVEMSENNDINIAKKAEEILCNDRNVGYQHYLMVRTDKKSSAEKLERVYKEYTSLNLSRVDSSISNSKIKAILSSLRLGELDGIICVDMLGEGYDFPNLKIAAIHVPHKSLASTLQFIGRFARTNANDIGKAKFIAVNNEELEIENNVLYSKDAVWQDMIIGMSENKNHKELEERSYYKDYAVEDDSVLESVPFQSIRPNCHVKIYKSTSFNINLDFPPSCNVADRVFRNYGENTIVGIGLEYMSPLWMGGGEKINLEHILYIVHFQTETNMVHIYSQNHSEVIYDEIISSFCEKYDPVPKNEIYKVLGELKDFEIFNSGMLSKQSQSGESYRIMAGSDVSSAIDKDSGRMYSAGHAFCKATNKTDEEITIGYSSASKVWSSSYKSLREYIHWCDGLGRKISNKKIEVKTNTNFDYLPQPKLLDAYPEDIFYVDFNAETYSSNPVIKYRIDGLCNSKHRLIDAIIKIKKCEIDRITLEVSIDDVTQQMECDLTAKYTSDESAFSVCTGNKEVSISDYFTEQPLIYKTVSDTSIMGIDVLEGDFVGELFDENIIDGIDWEKYNTDITLEFRKDENDERISVQDALYQILNQDPKYKYIIYDHGTGEIADYITVYETEVELIVELYHVKKKGAKTYNNSLGDIYEVVGQSLKSVTWFATKGKFIDKLKDRRNSNHCIIKKGGEFNDMILDFKISLKVFRGCIYMVQPGIKKSAPIADKIQELLVAADNYIKKAGKVSEFRIKGSL